MNLEEKLKLVKEVGEEIIDEKELTPLLSSGDKIIAYDGFEPSGQIHIAQGILRAINVNKMIKAGVTFKMWVADWHAWANNKMGGDLEKIKTVGRYFIEVWKASGMDMSHVEFHWASDFVKKDEYWKLVLQIARTNSLRRFIRTAEIMGREESMDLTAAQIIYPCMQCADIFLLGAKITQLGMDQRKVNMLAREIGPQLGFWKPVVVSHHMLMGLNKPQTEIAKDILKTKTSDVLDSAANLLKLDPDSGKKDRDYSPSTIKVARTIAIKMSKSNPDSAIFMTDTFEDIKRKITKAYCPEGEVQENPILEYCKYIIFESFDRLGINALKIERPEKFGGNLEIKTYEELVQIYSEKKLHPMDLKTTVIKLLDQLLQPVRKHFEENAEAKKLLETVRSYQVTR